eukprot:gene43034-64502_t
MRSVQLGAPVSVLKPAAKKAKAVWKRVASVVAQPGGLQKQIEKFLEGEDKPDKKEEVVEMVTFTGLLDKVFSEAAKAQLSTKEISQLDTIRSQVSKIMGSWENMYQGFGTNVGDDPGSSSSDDSLPEIDKPAAPQAPHRSSLPRGASRVPGVRHAHKVESKVVRKWADRRKQIREERQNVMSAVFKLVAGRGGAMGGVSIDDFKGPGPQLDIGNTRSPPPRGPLSPPGPQIVVGGPDGDHGGPDR